LLLSWGKSGNNAGEFNIAHNIVCDDGGWVYVADRENHRIQVFGGNGRYETQWNHMHRPSGLFMTGGKCPLCYIAELGPHLPVNLNHPNIGPRISVWDTSGKQLAQVQADPSRGTAPGQFISPHGIAADSAGNLYVGEVAYTSWPRSFPGVAQPDYIRCLQKLERIRAV
jgi:DNA-binding beta-propeller fold protein YncE